MDPLSVAAGIAGLISLGIQVTGSLVKFYTSYSGQDTDVTRTTGKLESLLDTFQFLQTALQSRTFQPDEQDLIKNIESSIRQCDELIQELKEECEKCEKASTTGIKGTIRAAGRRAAYPFRQSTLQKLDEAIGEIRHNLSIALDVLQLRDHKNTQDDIAELKSLLEVVRGTQISATIHDWLKAPDATVNHNAACAKRHPGTGIWFVKGPIFTTWLTQDNSFLWLSGFAGCGKSVLCSTAIQYTFRHNQSNPGVGIAFFYFTFNDESKLFRFFVKARIARLRSRWIFGPRRNSTHIVYAHGVQVSLPTLQKRNITSTREAQGSATGVWRVFGGFVLVG